MPKTSIVLTVYNKPQWLNQCMDSVLAQTDADWELLVMEDNSPDERVREIIHTYDDPRILTYFSGVQESERYATARYCTLINKAVREMSSGKYITYLTDDDFYYPERLELMTAYLDNHPEHSVVYGALHNVDADGNIAGDRPATEVLFSAWNKVDHNAVMHTREAFDNVDGWEDNYGTWGGGDAYFWRRLNNDGYIFYPIPEFVAAKRYHTGSVQWLMSNNLFPPKP